MSRYSPERKEAVLSKLLPPYNLTMAELYFPKKTNLAKHTQNDLDRVANQLNERPRKVLKYKAPSQMIRGVALSA